MHLMKGTIGAGIFSMGMAFKLSGWALTLCLTPLIGLIVLHCQHLLVNNWFSFKKLLIQINF